jgi:hypothetical protein
MEDLKSYWHISFELMYQLIIENLVFHNIVYRFYQNIEKELLFYLIHNRILLNDLIHQVWNLTKREIYKQKRLYRPYLCHFGDYGTRHVYKKIFLLCQFNS